MKLSVGKIAFPIEFDNGDKDVIYFNPNDPDLAKRMMSTADTMEKRINKIQFTDFSLKNNGDVALPTDVDDFDELSEEQKNAYKDVVNSIEALTNAIKEETDYIFNSDISKTVYKHCSPLAIINGEYCFKQFMREITKDIKKHIQNDCSEFAEIEKEHLGKYM